MANKPARRMQRPDNLKVENAPKTEQFSIFLFLAEDALRISKELAEQ